MFNSLKSRLWLTYFLIIILLLTAVGLGVLVTLRNNPLLYRQPLGQLETAVNMTSTVIAGVTDPMVLKSQIQTAAERSGIRLALYELDGKLVADSAALPGNRIELTVPRKDSIPGEVNFIDDVRGRSWL
jgi:hypothetical protein